MSSVLQLDVESPVSAGGSMQDEMVIRQAVASYLGIGAVFVTRYRYAGN